VTPPRPLPPATTLVAEMEQALSGGRESGRSALAGLIAELVNSNSSQWDLEDTTRDPDISDAVVATAKREIDRLNLGRHRLVQEIDAAVDAALEQPAVAPIATESPGMVLDRLSVLVIRRVRTAAASARDQAFADRLPVLDAQIATLSAAFDFYLEELRAGSRRFVPYEQLKLYAPSALTPEW
jgi:hypothetical protein